MQCASLPAELSLRRSDREESREAVSIVKEHSRYVCRRVDRRYVARYGGAVRWRVEDWFILGQT